MNRLLYTLRVLSGARFKKLSDVIDRVHERNGKNKFFILLDIIVCAVRYGAGYHDYIIFGFYDMSPAQRKTYVTRMINKRIIAMLNDQDYSYIFDEKNVFDDRFREYLGREFLDLQKTTFADFKSFIEGKEVIFAKPSIGESGKGIERLRVSDFSNLDEMYRYIFNKDKHFGVIEELLVQHEDMSKLYPLAINALRIVTIVVNGEAHCVYVVCKMGNEGKFVDNMENSGLCCPVDMDTGKIAAVAHTSKLIVYDKHPYTGIELVGYQLPYIQEAVALCKKAALEVKEIKYVGWDVCITPNGPVLIEGNDYPGYDFWQLPEQTPDKIGLLPYYKSLLPNL